MTIHRRQFIQNSVAAGAVLGAMAQGRSLRAAESPNEKTVLGVMGVNGRGSALAEGFAGLPGATVAYICDVDERAAAKAASGVNSTAGTSPKTVGDFQRVLDDKSVDALVIAAPDHWHGPATILACAAGKHVYVEKPASHNPQEGEWMVEAARKHNRVVQVGTQRRSVPEIAEAIHKVHSGAIGRVLFSRGWYNNARQSIGHGKEAPVPEWLDYSLWQGPAPERHYRDNLIHYNWHWFWHWGTGELGNNGIHALDVCRWGLDVDYPQRVVSGGGRYFYDDSDQQTPDTHTVTFDFGDKGITWEGRSWHRRGFEGSMFGSAFYGSEGTIIIDGPGYRMLDPKGNLIEESLGSMSERRHLQNFLDCIKTGERPHADIEIGHKSTLLCHLGNIAYRTGSTLDLDENGHISGNRRAAALWGRQYRKGWEPKV